RFLSCYFCYFMDKILRSAKPAGNCLSRIRKNRLYFCPLFHQYFYPFDGFCKSTKRPCHGNANPFIFQLHILFFLSVLSLFPPAGSRKTLEHKFPEDWGRDNFAPEVFRQLPDRRLLEQTQC